MIRVLAIDDEPLALLQLQNMIEKTPYFTLVDSCANAFDAMKVMQNHDIDVIFTDINMPDLSGLDFVRTLAGTPPIIVFTTAYTQYAIDGYKVNAIDYLLKPFGLPEFQRTAAKVKQHYDLLHPAQASEVQSEAVLPATEESLEGNILFLKVDYRIVRINIDELKYVESQSEYIQLVMDDGIKYMVLMSIRRMAELLPVNRFVRIHRSYIVNMSKVIELSRQRIKMDAETYLPVGDCYKEEVMDFITRRLVGK